MVYPTSGPRQPGRPNKVEAYRAFVEEMRAVEPGVMTRELLARARLAGYTGGKTAFYALVASARGASEPLPASAAPGEISHHDVGIADVLFASGERRRVHFLASRLAYSGWLTVSLVRGDGVEDVGRALVSAFVAIGGVPLLARFERPNPVAETWDAHGRVTGWRTSLVYLAAELGVGIDVRGPRELARRVRDGFFKGRVFTGEADIAAQLAAWCEEVDVRAPSDAAAAATPATLLADERRRMRGVAVTPEALEIREHVIVGAGGAVVHGSNVYFMPAAAAGRLGVLLLGRDQVRIVAGPYEATHPRIADRAPRRY